MSRGGPGDDATAELWRAAMDGDLKRIKTAIAAGASFHARCDGLRVICAPFLRYQHPDTIDRAFAALEFLVANGVSLASSADDRDSVSWSELWFPNMPLPRLQGC